MVCSTLRFSTRGRGEKKSSSECEMRKNLNDCFDDMRDDEVLGGRSKKAER